VLRPLKCSYLNATLSGVFSVRGELMPFTIFCQKLEKNSVPTLHIGWHLSFPPSSQPCHLSLFITTNIVKKTYNHLPLATCYLSHIITTMIIRKGEYVCLKNKNDFI